MDFNLYDFFISTKDKGIIFCFCGPVSQGIIEGIGQTIRQKMTLEEKNQSTIQKVFSVFIEQMQNVVNYSSERVATIAMDEGDLRIGILVVGNDDEAISVKCGNMIRTEDVLALSDKLSRLRDMDQDQLKTLYKERRRQEPEDGSKGAGLGFIDMARKASRPIEYDFRSVDAHSSFFSIKVVI